MSFLNQYSYLLVASVALLLLGVYLIRKGADRSGFIAFAALMLGLLLAFFLLRPTSSSPIEVDEVVGQIGSGQPVLLQFQSDYCIACLSAKPIVDGIEQEFTGRLIVLHINVLDPAGKELGRRFGFKYTPTFIFFDADGEERWRSVGAVDPAEVGRSLSSE